MITFKKLQDENNIKDLIKSIFDADLDLCGGWGYTQENATIINTLPKGMPLNQLQHMVTSIRAHLEMNITQEQDNRYGGINANERAREESETTKGIFNKVTYEITAMKEDLYTVFMKEYKENYGKEDFDLNAHFKRRANATLTQEVIHHFEVSQLS
jgi:hypothetical protein